ncbi:MAG TPA: AI-2E family transporter [Symbiobacteriaceae bacterium]
MNRRMRRVVAALVLGGLILAGGWGLWMIRPVLAPFLLAVAFAYLVAPLVNALVQRGMQRTWAILTVYLLLGAAGALAVVKLLPVAVSQLRSLTEAIPRYAMWAHGLVDSLQQQVRVMGAPPELRDVLDRTITEMEIRSVRVLQELLGIQTLQRAAGFLASLVLAPFLAFYMLRDMERFKQRFVQALPQRYRKEILMLLRDMDRVLSGFVRGEILLSFTVGCLAALAAALLGLRYSLLLGLWAGITELIPYVGPVLGAIPAVLAGLSISPLRGLAVVGAFAVIQQLENAVLSPKIVGERVGLHPLVVILAVLIGGYLAGAWGLILAPPVAGLLRVLGNFAVARLTMPVERLFTPAELPDRPEPEEMPVPGERPEPEAGRYQPGVSEAGVWQDGAYE